MPIYEFRCEGCEDRFEILAPVGSRPDQCPICGGVCLRLVPSRLGSARRTGRCSAGGLPERMTDVGARAEARLAQLGLGSDDQMGEIIERGRTGALLQEVAERVGES